MANIIQIRKNVIGLPNKNQTVAIERYDESTIEVIATKCCIF